MKKNKNLNENLDQQVLDDQNVETTQTAPIEAAAPVTEEKTDNNGKTGKKKASGKIVGLTVFQTILLVLTFPVLIGVNLVFAVKASELVPYYSFWPYAGVLITVLMALIFLGVTAVVTRKRSKRSLRYQTIAILLTALLVTAGLGTILDTALPDFIGNMTSSTLYIDDLYNNYEKQAEYNAGMVREFARLNTLNGNMDPEYAYKTLSKKDGSGYADTEVNTLYIKYEDMKPTVIDDLDGLRKELYDFIYQKYVLMDYDYALNRETGDGFLQNRKAFALALTDRILPFYTTLCKEGMSNTRLQYIFNNNYASMDQDGYVTFDDALLLYATSDRMTIPVVVRLILDDSHTYSDGAKAEIKDGQVVEPDGSYFFELFDPEAILKYYAADQIQWNNDRTAGVIIGDSEEDPYDGAVAIATIDASGEIISGGYVRNTIRWCVLDMDGNNMDITTLDLADTLSGLLGSIVPEQYMMIVNGLLSDGIDGLINKFFGGTIGTLLDENIPAVVAEAANGVKLAIHLYSDDEGRIVVTLTPTNVERGLLGYQYMTWLQLNNILFALISVYSIHNWMFIFGAVIIVLVLAMCFCREMKAKIREKEEADANPNADPNVDADKATELAPQAAPAE